jgi:hypothetical protein
MTMRRAGVLILNPLGAARRASPVVLLAVAVAACALVTTDASASLPELRIFLPSVDLTDDVPVRAAATCSNARPAVADGGEIVNYDVLVLLDGIPLERGRAMLTEAQIAYEPLHMKLVPTFESVAFTTDGTPTTLKMLELAKAHVGGAVPDGFDAVYAYTAKDLQGPAGQVACVGGVASPELSFATSEDQAGRNPNIAANIELPVWPWGDETANVIAHELGHLVGGNHDQANCYEGNLTVVPPEPCTIMHANFSLALKFSTPNALNVRAFAVKYAKP